MSSNNSPGNGSSGARDDDLLVARAQQQVQALATLSDDVALAAAGQAAGATDDLPRTLPDSFAGYRVLKEIHRGGQGVIYQALQESTKRKVAIKVMREGPFAGPGDHARFDREVSILSQLNHPNIVAIHDTGQVAGVHFFVMDYIRGQPLDVHMAGGRRTVTETLRLFAKICHAVNAAHLRGVIHRDLKPGNIRIDEHGEPHILDFGLAKVAATDAEASAMTMTGQFVGSLPWAAPEQAEGLPSKIDTRTDVYALGVILYQMLTSKLPYEVAGNIRDVLDRIMRAEPTRPRTLRRDVDDEVETIVLKCLQKERERRYQTAGEVARDVERYLRGDPIDAKRDSHGYLLKKTLRRYRVPIAVAGGFVIMAILGGIALGLQAAQLAQERDRALAAENGATREAERVTATTDFYRELLRGVGLSVSASTNLQTPLTRAEATSLLDRLAVEVEGAFQEDLELKADAHASLATGFLSLRLLPEAEAHVRRALACRGRAFGQVHPRYLNSLVDLGRLLEEQSRNDEAGEAFRAAYDGLCAAVGEGHPDSIRAARHLASSMNLVFRFDEAETLFRRIRELQRGLPDGDLSEGLWSTRGLARMLMRTGRLEEGERLAREVIQTAVHGMGRDTGLLLESGLATLAEALAQQGRYRAACELMERLVAISGRLHGDRDPGVEHFRAASAWYLCQTGDEPEAEGALRDILASQRQGLGLGSGYTRITESFLGRLLNAAGRFAEAEVVCSEGVQACERHEGLEHGVALTLMIGLGTAHHGLGHLEQAAAVFRQADEVFQGFPERRDILVRTELQRRYGRCLTDLGRYAEAETMLLSAYEGEARMRGQDHENTQTCLADLGTVYDRWGRMEKAAEYRGLIVPPQVLAAASQCAAGLLRELGTTEAAVRYLESDSSQPEPVRVRALQYIHHHGRDVETHAAVCWWFLRAPGAEAMRYQDALAQAREACRLEPGNGVYLRNLGAALYRVGAYEEALATLRSADALNAAQAKGSHPADVAFIAMACQCLGWKEQARAELDLLRKLMEDGGYTEREELRALLGEAEAPGRSAP